MNQRSTIKTIAEMLGVSPSTVSRAFQPDSHISDTLRAKILDTAEQFHYVPNRAASRLTMREIHIGILMKNNYPHGKKELLRGFEDAYRSLSDYKVSYHLELFQKNDLTRNEWQQLLSRFKNDDALIITGIDQDIFYMLLEESADTYPLIVSLQAGRTFAPSLFYSMHDPTLTAKMAAEFLSNCLFGKSHPRVLLFTGNKQLNVHTDAEAAFCQEAENLGLNVAGVYDMQDSEAVLQKLVERELSPERMADENTTIDGIFITSGISLPLCRYLEAHDLGKKIALVTFDVFPELYPYIEDHTVNATIYQNMYKQGYDALTYTIKYLIENIKPPKVVSPHPEIIMRVNLPLYSENEKSNI